MCEEEDRPHLHLLALGEQDGQREALQPTGEEKEATVLKAFKPIYEEIVADKKQVRHVNSDDGNEFVSDFLEKVVMVHMRGSNLYFAAVNRFTDSYPAQPSAENQTENQPRRPIVVYM